MPHWNTSLGIKIKLLIHALNATQGHKLSHQNTALLMHCLNATQGTSLAIKIDLLIHSLNATQGTSLAIKIELLIHALNATQGHKFSYQNRATNTRFICHTGTHA